MRTPSFFLPAALVLLWFAAPVLAEDATSSLVSEYRITSWSGGDGITLGSIRSLAQTPDGFLWLASDAGLVRFDGFRFAASDLVSGNVELPLTPSRAVYVARDGALWVGYGNGMGVLRIQDGEVREVHLQKQFPGFVNAIIEDRHGAVWVGHDHGLMRRQQGTWAAVPLAGAAGRAVYDVHEDRSGTIWVSGADGLYRSTADGTLAFVPESAGLAREISEDAAGRVWTTDQNLAFRRAGVASPDVQLQGRGMSVLHDRHGDLWVATIGQGLWRVQQRDGRTIVQKLTVQAGLSTDEVGGLLEDREGNIWAGSIQGLNRLTPHKVRSIIDLGLVNAVAVQGNGVVLAGTTTGLVALEGVSTREAGTRRVIASGTFGTLHRAADGIVWAAGTDGLVRIAGGRAVAVATPGLALTRVTSIASEGGDVVWASDGNAGLVRLQHGRVARLAEMRDETGRPPHLLLVDSQSRLWMAFPSGRLQVRDRSGRVRAYGEADGLPHRQLLTLALDRRGGLWVGGNAGLSYLHGDRFQTLNFAEGSIERPVVAVTEDYAGDVWIAVGWVGIVHTTAAEVRRALADPRHVLRYRLYNPSEGTAGWPDPAVGAGVATGADHTLWFVTGRGLTTLDPREMRSDQNGPPEVPRIEGIYANERRYPALGGTALPSGTTRVRIDYTLVNLASSDQIRFRYRLDGFDKDWVESARRQAVYTNLPPGEYRFRVQAARNRGSWGDPEVEWPFTIEPVFYQTRGFYAAGALLLTLAGVSAWRLRIGQLRREMAVVFAERLRLGREIHDTLLQSLVGVSLQLDALAHEVNESATQAAARAVSMRKQLEEYIREARESIWDLRSSTLRDHGLIGALRESGERLTAGKMHFSLRVSGTPRPCPAHVERHVLRIAYEAIMNTVQHSGAERVDVELVYQRSQLLLRIVDDGRGFAAGAVALGHYGVLGMRERAEDAGGHLSIESRPGGGVAVLAAFPLGSFAWI